MTSTLDESIKQLRSFNFPAVFECIQKDSGIPSVLKSFSHPRFFYGVREKNTLHEQAPDWLPLWERWGFVLYAFDLKRRHFLIFDYSCKEMEIVAHSYQQFITYVLFHVAENGGWDELEELATAFSYRYLDKLKDRFEEETDLDFETYCLQVVAEIEQS